MGLDDVLRRIRIAAIGFVVVYLVGVLGFSWINSGGALMDAFYMTALIITTIGFHEIIDLSNSTSGRIFAISIAFSGIGILTYLLSNLSALFIEGDLRKTFYRKKMMKKISQMQGHYIICGCGRVGRNIAMELYQTNRPFVLTDISEHVLEEFQEKMPDALCVSGDSTDEVLLESLALKNADGLFATAADDNTNLVICLTARQLSPSIKIIARLNDMSRMSKMNQAGADKVISPNHIGGLQMASEMIRPIAASFMDDIMRSSGMDLRMEEIPITEKSKGLTLGEISLSNCENTIILALKTNNNWIYNPKKNELLLAGGFLIVLTTPAERETLAHRLQ